MPPVPDAPWDAGKLEAVLAAACFEHFANNTRTTLCSSDGTCEAYEVADFEDDDDPLILVRTSDGRRFEVDFFATVSEVKPDA